MNNIVIGLTGPIASGKDAAAKIFGRHGARVINADSIGHKVIEPQMKAWHSILKVFGSKVLNRGGGVNRKKLGNIVFSNRTALQKLGRITHPEMRKMIKNELKAAKRSGKKLIVINAALLEEMKLMSLVDKVISVSSRKSVRLKRLLQAGLTRREALARIRSQDPDQRYRKISDVVLYNNGSLGELREKVKRIISSL